MIVEFKSFSEQQSKIAFCLVDRTESCASGWIKELIKNQADYTICNVVGKTYDLFQGIHEDELLNYVTSKGYEYAVVFSTGTEFINGYEFFKKIESYTDTDIALAGHILDRGSAYYELHSQCYYINLNIYKQQGCPKIGDTELGTRHQQSRPIRSEENYHDDYTPLWVSSGNDTQWYEHRCHGWNILSKYLDNQIKIEVFDNDVKNNKLHLYPEYPEDFNKHISLVYHRQNYCAKDFVHTANTEWPYRYNEKFTQIITPASGLWYEKLIENFNSKVVFYDYNRSAINYWQSNLKKRPFVEYKFVELDLLNNKFDIRDLVTNKEKTVLNLSNIFCYEGTAYFYSLAFKIYKENQLLQNLKEYFPEIYVHYNMRAAGAFGSHEYLHGNIKQAKDIELTELASLKTPTWHIYDWH